MRQTNALDICRQSDMGFGIWVGNVEIATMPFFIPCKILATQLEEPLVNHSVIMIPYGTDMPVDVPVPHALRRVADMLDRAKPGNPDHPGHQKVLTMIS